MTYWQPHGLPSTEIRGSISLDGQNSEFETSEIMQILDQLALRYTSETLK